VELGSVAVIALIAGLAGGAVAAALVGTVEGMLRRPRTARGVVSHGGGWRQSGVVIQRSRHTFSGTAPFTDFNDRAMRVLALATDEAQRFNHASIGPEHLLLGLSRDGEGVGARVLDALGATLPRLRAAVESTIGRGTTTVAKIDLSEPAKTAIGNARGEAHKLGHARIGTEHLLIGLVQEGGAANAILRAIDLDPGRVGPAVIATLGRPEAAMPFAGLDADSRRVMALARQEAIQAGHSYIGSENLAMALRLFSNLALDGLWNRLAIDGDSLRRRIEAAVRPTKGPAPAETAITPRVGRIIAMAGAIAAKRERLDVPPEYLLMALADEGGGVGAQTLAALGATAPRIREIVDGPKP
jgi:ATP-dependent Clp protease ATP-binding subunit ClpA